MLRMALVALFVPFAAQAAAPLKQGKDWRNCSQDAQCVEIEGMCGKTAVNVAAKDVATAFYKQEAARAHCVEMFWKPKETVVRCHLGGCDMRPKQDSDKLPPAKK